MTKQEKKNKEPKQARQKEKGKQAKVEGNQRPLEQPVSQHWLAKSEYPSD
jgi:hypothetical protein